MASEPSVPASATLEPAETLLPADAGRYSSAIATLRRLMWECAGVIRNAQGLQQALDQLQQLKLQAPSASAMRAGESREALRIARQWHSIRTTAEAVLHSALAREESRGGHYREDFPEHRDDLAGRHSFQTPGRKIWFCS
jgi:succinate dehydrogenase/fumarate reductase flavoprotein subunit